MDPSQDRIAKVRVAGSNPVVRSKCRPLQKHVPRHGLPCLSRVNTNINEWEMLVAHIVSVSF